MKLPCLTIALAVSIIAADRQDLHMLYTSRAWRELSEAVRADRGATFYRGVAAAVFGEDHKAEMLLESVVKSQPQSEDAYNAHEWLAHVYLRTGQYRRLITNMEARWRVFPNRTEIKNEQAQTAGFRNLPDQSAGTPKRSTLPHEPGEIFIPLRIGRGKATYFFDTGAWVNGMSESEAIRLGLTIHGTDGSLGTATGPVQFRTAVAPEVSVGKVRFKNVSFAIFLDSQEPWRDLPVGRRGVIGIPILTGLRTLKWVPNGTVTVGGRGAALNTARSNLFFDDDHLVLAAKADRQTMLATLDTGAVTTDLYEKFAVDFPALTATGKQDRTEVRAMAKAETFDSITLSKLPFEIDGLTVTLRPAHVLRKQLGPTCCAANIGMDLLGQSGEFTIDFRSMRLVLKRIQSAAHL